MNDAADALWFAVKSMRVALEAQAWRDGCILIREEQTLP